MSTAWGAASTVVRPAVWVNCAVSADGRLAYAGGARARLSGPEDLERVQRLRADAHGIVVGVGTVLLDDPSLRVHWELLHEEPGRSPYRIVLDSLGRTPSSARILDGSAPTIIATVQGSPRAYPATVETIVAGEATVDLDRLFRILHERGFRRILVEGGARVLASVLRAGLFDRLTVYVAPTLIGGATAPMMMAGPECPGPEMTVPLKLLAMERLGDGHLLSYAPASPSAPTRPSPLSGASSAAPRGSD